MNVILPLIHGDVCDVCCCTKYYLHVITNNCLLLQQKILLLLWPTGTGCWCTKYYLYVMAKLLFVLAENIPFTLRFFIVRNIAFILMANKLVAAINSADKISLNVAGCCAWNTASILWQRIAFYSCTKYCFYVMAQNYRLHIHEILPKCYGEQLLCVPARRITFILQKNSLLLHKI